MPNVKKQRCIKKSKSKKRTYANNCKLGCSEFNFHSVQISENSLKFEQRLKLARIGVVAFLGQKQISNILYFSMPLEQNRVFSTRFSVGISVFQLRANSCSILRVSTTTQIFQTGMLRSCFYIKQKRVKKKLRKKIPLFDHPRNEQESVPSENEETRVLPSQTKLLNEKYSFLKVTTGPVKKVSLRFQGCLFISSKNHIIC